MAKGFGSRGMGGLGGGINMNMIKQAQKMQQDMQKMQAELETKEYTAQAGGGVVSATVSGKHELRSITIDPEAPGPDRGGGERGHAHRLCRRRLCHGADHRGPGPAVLRRGARP